jgi:hypothetical protein
MTMTDNNADGGMQPPRMHRFHFILNSDNAAKLLRAAAQRKMHPNKFASLVMGFVTRDNLIDAVLDDGGGGPPRKTRRNTANAVMRSPI